jgi:hypothetical protein
MTKKLKTKHEHLGYELDWIAVDHMGHVAVFQSAGFGPIPERYEKNPDFDLLEKLGRLPELGEARFPRVVDFNTYEDERLAKRGFYSYDWNHKELCYELIAEPTVPLHVDILVASNVVKREMVVELGEGFSGYE